MHCTYIPSHTCSRQQLYPRACRGSLWIHLSPRSESCLGCCRLNLWRRRSTTWERRIRRWILQPLPGRYVRLCVSACDDNGGFGRGCYIMSPLALVIYCVVFVEHHVDSYMYNVHRWTHATPVCALLLSAVFDNMWWCILHAPMAMNVHFTVTISSPLGVRKRHKFVIVTLVEHNTQSW